jgi:quercetin dioxygenase-like cupin family protein
VIEYAPGRPPRRHRTESIDYAIVISGEIDMELEDESESVHLKAGDVLVQRGTLHNWVNNGSEPCLIAFILIDATPVAAGDKLLGESIPD